MGDAITKLSPLDPPVTASDSPPVTQATFAIGDERTASRIVDAITESYPSHDLAIAAFEAPGGRWDITMHFGEPPDQDFIRSLVTDTAGEAAASSIVFGTVETKDWVKASLADLVPVSAGRFIVHGSHDRDRVPTNKLGIEIEAALAFGTGHHGTTRGCLLLLDQVLNQRTPKRVLDLGSGTGVLAIAAAKALRRRVLATDIDFRSVIVASENAHLNGVGTLVEAVHATGFHAPDFAANGPFGLVMANILANPLRRLAPDMARHLAPHAFVILSGLLPHQANSVVAAYRGAGLKLLKRIQIDGWSSLLMQRR
ncbi:50S ribosomal protein L11 methyltransferase [Afipia clevelandensis]|uniref:Ribosomal protein L11 methyltransferase n=1 Tax=Afipia clevelandensis ATCC 49720 TaxID=883079 RepID=K8NZR9_9BRAD|nr:50S ribosomal protein L11 methyltransferase [Afipia clevelandensis]EKS35812.1 ribosomal protein L11 methyltransferase [Afipia clevelandensis ATCC 49720]